MVERNDDGMRFMRKKIYCTFYVMYITCHRVTIYNTMYIRGVLRGELSPLAVAAISLNTYVQFYFIITSLHCCRRTILPHQLDTWSVSQVFPPRTITRYTCARNSYEADYTSFTVIMTKCQV